MCMPQNCLGSAEERDVGMVLCRVEACVEVYRGIKNVLVSQIQRQKAARCQAVKAVCRGVPVCLDICPLPPWWKNPPNCLEMPRFIFFAVRCAFTPDMR